MGSEAKSHNKTEYILWGRAFSCVPYCLKSLVPLERCDLILKCEFGTENRTLVIFNMSMKRIGGG